MQEAGAAIGLALTSNAKLWDEVAMAWVEKLACENGPAWVDSADVECPAYPDPA